jgi:predicted Fe-Mo cluster-binding NifX family protein
MKIAIASEGKDENSMISERAGRAPYYIIIKDKGRNKSREIVKIIKNPFAIGGGGAGWSVADMLSDENINLFIAGNMGGNIKIALKQKDIKMKISSGKIKEIIKFKGG